MKFINKNLVKNLFGLFFVVYLLVVPVLSFAQVTPSQPVAGTTPSDPSITNTEKLTNPIKVDDVNSFIKILLEGILRLGMPIVALAIIYSGFLFVAARGNAEKLSTAKDALTYTMIGAAILLGSWAIAILISETVRAL